jgi:hypothetical protein
MSHCFDNRVDRGAMRRMRGTGIGCFHLLEYFAPQHRDAAWSFDTQLHAFTVDSQHGDGDVIAYQKALVALAAQHEHA